MRTRSQTSRPTATLHFFPLLPAELRVQIWQHAVSQKPALLPRAPIPCRALLTTCRESRAIFLSVYTLCFHPVMRPYMSLIKWHISLWANLKHDILYIDPEMDDLGIFDRNVEEWLTPAAMGKDGIKHMAIEKEYWRELDPFQGGGLFDSEQDQRLKLAGLQGLKKVTLVLNDYSLVDIDDDPPPLDERSLLEYPDKVVEPEHSKVFCDISQTTPGWVIPAMNIGRIVYD